MHELLKVIPPFELNKIDKDLTINGHITWDPNPEFIQEQLLETYRHFHYQTGRFPGDNNIISISRAQISEFIELKEVVSPLVLYEKYSSHDMRGMVSVQLLAALNIFVGGSGQVSRNAMSELFPKLS